MIRLSSNPKSSATVQMEQLKTTIYHRHPQLHHAEQYIQNSVQAWMKDVEGPVIAAIIPKSEDCANFLSCHFEEKDLTSFVCPTKEVLDKLWNCVRVEKDLPINIATVDSPCPLPLSPETVSLLNSKLSCSTSIFEFLKAAYLEHVTTTCNDTDDMDDIDEDDEEIEVLPPEVMHACPALKKQDDSKMPNFPQYKKFSTDTAYAKDLQRVLEAIDEKQCFLFGQASNTDPLNGWNLLAQNLFGKGGIFHGRYKAKDASSVKSLVCNVWASLSALESSNSIQQKLKAISREQEQKYNRKLKEGHHNRGKAAGQAEMLQKILLEFEKSKGAVPSMKSRAAVGNTTGLSRKGDPRAGPVFKAYANVTSLKNPPEPAQNDQQPTPQFPSTGNIVENSLKSAASLASSMKKLDGVLSSMAGFMKMENLHELQQMAEASGNTKKARYYMKKRLQLLKAGLSDDSSDSSK